MAIEDKLDLLLRRIEEYELRREEADRRARADIRSLIDVVEACTPEVGKKAKDLLASIKKEQSKVTPTTCRRQLRKSSHLLLARVMVVELSSTEQFGSENISFKGKHVDKLRLFGMPPWLPLVCFLEAREGKCCTTDSAASIISWNEQKKMMTTETCTCFEQKMQKFWDLTFQVSLTTLASKESNLVICDPKSLSVWLSSVDLRGMLLNYYQTRVEKWNMRIICMVISESESCLESNYIGLNAERDLLYVIADEKGCKRVKEMEEDANSIHDEKYTFELVSAEVVNTLGSTGQCICLTDEIGMPINGHNHEHRWTMQLIKRGCHCL
jgi:hypothetical protein